MTPLPFAADTFEHGNILLVVEDDAILELLNLNLRYSGLICMPACSAADARKLLSRVLPDAAIVDEAVRGAELDSFARELRADPRTANLPLILVGKDMESAGLPPGEPIADDFIARPFSPLELVRRVRMLLRHRGTPEQSGLLVAGPLTLDCLRHQLYAQLEGVRTSLPLGSRGYEVLHALMRFPDRALTRENIIECVWTGLGEIDIRTVDVNVKRLRRALAEVGLSSMVETVRGVGYRLAVEATSPRTPCPPGTAAGRFDGASSSPTSSFG